MKQIAAGALFVTFDGAKGVGKSTLIALTADLLRSAGQHVAELCEKELDPHRGGTKELLATFVRYPTLEAEVEVCIQLARGRAWISSYIQSNCSSGSIVLIDRWYPSDAAFRRIVSFDDVLAINRSAGVLAPDFVVAASCPPRVSWNRAHTRDRGLSSVMVSTYKEHVRCTRKFATTAVKQGWTICNTERAAQDCAAQIGSAIAALRQHKALQDCDARGPNLPV